MEASSGRTVRCVVVTPERAVLDDKVDFVALPMYDGELGVLPGRAPLIGRLGYGELRIKKGDEVRRFFVDSGFVQVRDNVVTVLTARALKASDINRAAAEETLVASLAAATPEEHQAKVRAQERARAQLRMSERV
ncbi:MAG: ATP synthase F1 subunit epsilon [Gemmataceae bacterium]